MKQWAKVDQIKCRRCQRKNKSPAERGYHYSIEHHLDECGDKIAIMVTNILALSLLGPDLHTLLIRLPRPHEYGEVFKFEVKRALVRGSRVQVAARTIIDGIRGMLGTDFPSNYTWPSDGWIASSVKGQVAFPRLLATMVVGYEPCLQIVCVPGILSFLEKPPSPALQSVVGEGQYRPMIKQVTKATTVPSSQVGNLSRFTSVKHEWKCRSDGYRMVVHLTPKDTTGNCIMINPNDVLEQSFRVLFAPDCSHPRDQQPNHVIEDYYFVHPDLLFSHRLTEKDEQIAIYAVRDNDPLRLMILGSLPRFTFGSHDNSVSAVVGGNSCLSCSLNVCRQCDAKRLIC